jgi:predicted MFS family arabinose efflux permease
MMPDAPTRNVVLMFLSVAFVLDHLDRHILNITLNQIGTEFALNDFQLGLLSGLAFALIHVVFAFPLARLSVPGRRKTIVVSALSAWSVLTMAMGAATSFAQLLALRFGVGIGEAGYVPPAHSMIADQWPEEKRTTALAIFSAATNVGLFLAFIVGGFVAANYGWRAAFLVAGLPGVIWALVLFFRFKEPHSDSASVIPQELPTYTALALRILQDRGTRHTIYGAVLAATVGYGATAWIATFLIRSHGLDIAQVGLYLAFAIGIGGALGTALGGRCVDWYGRGTPGRRLKFVAVTILIAKPLAIAFYLTEATHIALWLFVIPAAFGAIFTAPTFAQVYRLVAPSERPMTSALMLLALNFVGLGLGPIIVGAISTALSAGDVGDALRIAMVILQLFGFWAAFHYWKAGQIIDGSPLKDRPNPPRASRR